jgi:hypothetical protein
MQSSPIASLNLYIYSSLEWSTTVDQPFDGEDDSNTNAQDESDGAKQSSSTLQQMLFRLFHKKYLRRTPWFSPGNLLFPLRRFVETFSNDGLERTQNTPLQVSSLAQSNLLSTLCVSFSFSIGTEGCGMAKIIEAFFAVCKLEGSEY